MSYLLSFKIFYYYVYVCLLCAHMCMDTHGGQKKASDPLALELEVVVRHLMSAGNSSPLEAHP